MFGRTLLVVVTVSAVMAHSAVGVAQQLEVIDPANWVAPVPPPNQVIWDALNAAAAKLDHDQEYDEVGAYAIIRELRVTLENRFIGPQLVYYLEENLDDEAGYQAIVPFLCWLDISVVDVAAEGMALYAAQNAGRKKAVFEISDMRTGELAEFTNRRSLRGFPAVLSGYAHQGKAVASPFIRLMYEMDPHEATRVMARVQLKLGPLEQRKEITWATLVVEHDRHRRQWDPDAEPDVPSAEAMAKLDWMSQHGEWWVRLFVAELIRKDEAYRTPELVARLENDANPLVANAVHHAYWWPGGD